MVCLGSPLISCELNPATMAFVKKAQRVEALALVMALTLMVYTLDERKLRQTLAAQQQTVLDQKKQPTAKPTFR